MGRGLGQPVFSFIALSLRSKLGQTPAGECANNHIVVFCFGGLRVVLCRLVCFLAALVQSAELRDYFTAKLNQ